MTKTKKVTAKPEDIEIYQFSDTIEDPYKLATERLYDFQRHNDLMEKFSKLDSRSCIDFISKIVQDIE